jgi:hypothetical protein
MAGMAIVDDLYGMRKERGLWVPRDRSQYTGVTNGLLCADKEVER